MTETALRHAEQVDYWNGDGARRWLALQARRDALMAGFTPEILKAAAAQPGETVIDVGCGCGETSAELAKAVGPSGKILAVDVSASLIAHARRRLDPYPGAQALLADAANFAFEPGGADLLFSRFGVMFFGDPQAAFGHLRKALKPQGRLVFACWRTPVENAWMTGATETVYLHVPRPPPPDPDLPSPFAFANPQRVSKILTAAGFDPPKIEKLDAVIDLANGDGVAGAVVMTLTLGPAARLLEGQPQEVIERVRSSLEDHFSPLMTEGRIELPAGLWLVSAAPSSD